MRRGSGGRGASEAILLRHQRAGLPLRQPRPGEEGQSPASLRRGIGERGLVVLSTQVLQEFYWAVTRKLASPLPEEVAEERVRDFCALPLVRVDSPTTWLPSCGVGARATLSGAP